MTDYIPTIWENEVPGGNSLRYKLTNLDGSVLSEGATIELITPVTPGTPVNATNLNKIEQGIKTAQDTANQGVSDASAAQGTANLARNEAAAAKTTADTGVANASAAHTAANNAAGAATNAQTSANAAQSSANNALAVAQARIPIFDHFERVTEYSHSIATWTDVPGLSKSIIMPTAGVIHVWASGVFRADTQYVGAAIRIVIDGTPCPYPSQNSCNHSTYDTSWRSFGQTFYKAVAAGTREIKIQISQNGAGAGNAILLHCGVDITGYRTS